MTTTVITQTFKPSPVDATGSGSSQTVSGGFGFGSTGTVPAMSSVSATEWSLMLSAAMTGTIELTETLTLTYPGDGTVLVAWELMLKAITAVAFVSGTNKLIGDINPQALFGGVTVSTDPSFNEFLSGTMAINTQRSFTINTTIQNS